MIHLKQFACTMLIALSSRSFAQDMESLRKKYLGFEEAAFKATIIYDDPFREKALTDEKFYRIVMPQDSMKRQWINYRIEHIDSQLKHLSVYTPDQGRIMIAQSADTFRQIYQLNQWDSAAPCLQNPVSHSCFALSFPFTECFFSSGKYITFQTANGSWYFSDIHPYTGYKRKVWVNRTSGLIDSIHEFKGRKLVQRISFQYYYTRDKAGTESFLPLPPLYPIAFNNPNVMQILHSKLHTRTLNHFDSSRIQKFLSNRTKPMLIDFWFIGCRPCHQSFPVFERLRKTYPSEWLDIVGFSPFDTKDEVFRFRALNALSFDMQYDSLHLNLFYQVNAYPCTILIDTDGEILYRHEGMNGRLEEELRLVLNEVIQQHRLKKDD